MSAGKIEDFLVSFHADEQGMGKWGGAKCLYTDYLAICSSVVQRLHLRLPGDTNGERETDDESDGQLSPWIRLAVVI